MLIAFIAYFVQINTQDPPQKPSRGPGNTNQMQGPPPMAMRKNVYSVDPSTVIEKFEQWGTSEYLKNYSSGFKAKFDQLKGSNTARKFNQ